MSERIDTEQVLTESDWVRLTTTREWSRGDAIDAARLLRRTLEQERADRLAIERERDVLLKSAKSHGDDWASADWTMRLMSSRYLAWHRLSP